MQQLKQKDIKPLRIKLHKEQDSTCPIFKQKYDVSEMTLDHQHKNKKTDKNGVDGGGLVRGCIHNQANVVEGKISNAYRRYGIHNIISLPEFLRNLADYLERENYDLIHPTEAPKSRKLKKRSYNQLRKAYTGKAKFPPYRVDRKGKGIQTLTKPLAKLFEKYDIEPQFYD